MTSPSTSSYAYTSISSTSSSLTPSSTSSLSSSPSYINSQPEAEAALDLASAAFHQQKYFKAETLCIRALKLYISIDAKDLLRRIYEHIPLQHRNDEGKRWLDDVGINNHNATNNTSESNHTSSTSSINNGFTHNTNDSSASSPRHMESSSSVFSSIRFPSWLYIPPRDRLSLLIVWSAVFLVACLRFSSFSTPSTSSQRANTASAENGPYRHPSSSQVTYYVLQQSLFPLLFLGYFLWKANMQRANGNGNG